MDYKKLLTDSYNINREYSECPPESRLEYLSAAIFDFTTYDGEKDKLFARKAVEVCKAINDGTTFNFIEDEENYTWYLLMVNMPFFANKLEWGTSIRGAWWRHGEIEFATCHLWDGEKQLIEPMRFKRNEWIAFISAVIEFADSTNQSGTRE